MTGSARRPTTVARLPVPPGEGMAALVRALEQRNDLDKLPLITGYTVSNYTTTRTLNAGTAVVADVANFLCTLVDDLIAAGKIKKA